MPKIFRYWGLREVSESSIDSPFRALNAILGNLPPESTARKRGFGGGRMSIINGSVFAVLRFHKHIKRFHKRRDMLEELDRIEDLALKILHDWKVPEGTNIRDLERCANVIHEKIEKV